MVELPVSVGQRLLSLMDHYLGEESALNEQVLWRIEGQLDAGALRVALTKLVARHAALRTAFVGNGRRLRQVVHEPSPVALAEADVTGHADPDTAARERVSEEMRRTIDAATSPIRPLLIRIAPATHLFVLTMHHFVTDDWSNGLLSRDLRRLYAAELAGADDGLPAVGWQYAEWSEWQRERLSGAGLRELTEYWRHQLDGARIPELPERASAPGEGEQPWVSVELPIGPETTRALRDLARRERTTLFPVLLSVFSLLLHDETRQRDITVASLFANRGSPQVADSVGFFVTMLLLRTDLDRDSPARELVRATRKTVLAALRHQELPYQLLPPGTISSRTGRADDITFQLVGSLKAREDLSGAEIDDMEGMLERRRFAFEFVVAPHEDRLIALLLCDRQRFDADWAARFVAGYVAVADALAADPDRPAGDLLAPQRRTT
ncbi:condensation domain-containing protein [Amycolatopsis minnesotensis]|uniref:condensation domain-containing protein n=1 Tax=Amycolatopsis minnesotensis TaxID=337894 RepID=UPI0031D868DD